MIAISMGYRVFSVFGHVPRTTEEEKGRTEMARVEARLERARAVRWKNIVVQCQRTRRGRLVEREMGGRG